MYKIFLSEVNTNFSFMKYKWELIEETKIGHMILGSGYSPTLDEAYEDAKKEYSKCKRRIKLT